MPEQLSIVEADPAEDWTPGKESDECYTPAWILELAARAMGGPIETDPAWSPRSLVRPTAHAWTHHDDGANRPWFGRVWVNPPYSKPDPFMVRASEHAAMGRGPVIALVKLDPTTAWWAIAMRTAHAVVLLRDRVRFLGEYAGGKSGAMFPSAVIVWDCDPFPAFRHTGWVLR